MQRCHDSHEADVRFDKAGNGILVRRGCSASVLWGAFICFALFKTFVNGLERKQEVAAFP